MSDHRDFPFREILVDLRDGTVVVFTAGRYKLYTKVDDWGTLEPDDPDFAQLHVLSSKGELALFPATGSSGWAGMRCTSWAAPARKTTP